MQTEVAVIGAGVAGLYACRLLQAASVDFMLFEARDRIGGRVLTVDEDGGAKHQGFDLGPSWFWPEAQPRIAKLVSELRLAAFEQNTEGDVVFERMSREPAQRYGRMSDGPRSMRLAGGTGTLVRTLGEALPQERIHLNSRVTEMALGAGGIELSVDDIKGNAKTISARYVLASLPPRLLEAIVSFTPSLDPVMAHRWRSTPTWMAGQAKFFALYDRPFWRDAGLSGTAQSMVGPMVEMHDATTSNGAAAIFGFIGIQAEQRAAYGETVIASACVEQLARIFGPEARSPRRTLMKDWASDPFTATQSDQVPAGHPVAGDPRWVTGDWQDRLLLCATETSPVEPGYLAGALEAADVAVGDVRQRLNLG